MSLQRLRKRVDRARQFPSNTCAASRHLHIMAEALLKGGYPMLTEEPTFCAETMLSVLASLWEARTQLRRQQHDRKDLRRELLAIEKDLG